MWSVANPEQWEKDDWGFLLVENYPAIPLVEPFTLEDVEEYIEPYHEIWPNQAVWYEYEWNLEEHREYSTAGYSGYYGGYMWEDVGRCYSSGWKYFIVDFYFFKDKGTCRGGQSGSPVWTMLGNKRRVVGILRTDICLTTKLQNYMLDIMDAIVKEDKP